jgi:hypothetical protein
MNTTSLTTQQLTKFILNRYDGLMPQATWGETSFFYNPDSKFARGTYFATIKEKDGDNDKASQLDREGVWRLNFGTVTKSFGGLFGPKPARPAKGGVIAGEYDFTKLDVLTPHPIYGWMGWVCILNPSQKSIDLILPLIDEYFQITKKRFEKRLIVIP